MATFQEIQNYINVKHGKVVKTCWIAHAKQINGIPLVTASQWHLDSIRNFPCPDEILPLMNEAFLHFKLTSDNSVSK